MFTAAVNTIITAELAAKYIGIHKNKMTGRLEKLRRYYDGHHSVLQREKGSGLANNKVVVNHASYIADISAGYLAGTPCTYKSKHDITKLTDVLKRADSATQDSDLALDLAIYGRAFELVYMNNDTVPEPRLAKLDPRNAFVVYDDTVRHDPLFGVTYYPIFNDRGNVEHYACCLYTDNYEQPFEMSSSLIFSQAQQPKEHHFGAVPLNEIYNNQNCQGDFEQVISLIDAYDLLMSDRVNDKEQFVNALLLIKGAVLGDTDKERSETYRAVKNNGVLELPEGAEAAYLARQFDESSVEILRSALKKDIHTISKVPDMSDDNFGGNVSGVAMAYKLFGFELMTKTKERFFKEGLRYRLRLIDHILSIRGQGTDTADIEIIMTRSLPANTTELADMVANLSGTVSLQTLLSQLPFVEDPQEEMKRIRKEKQDSADYQQSLFSLRSDGDTVEGE